MKKLILLTSVLTIGFITYQIKADSQPSNQVDNQRAVASSYSTKGNAEDPCGLSKNRFCFDKKQQQVCNVMPSDVDFKKGFGYNSELRTDQQQVFDIFSWQVFIALNFPADENGVAMKSINEAPNNRRVWEHWITADKLMKEASKNVLALEQSAKQKVLYSTSKISDDDDLTNFLMIHKKPLIDKNGNFVLYEQRVNNTLKKFVEKYGLTTKTAIKKFVESNQDKMLHLPPNKQMPDVNAIEIKAAWRILQDGDDANRYYTKEATIVIDTPYVDGQQNKLVVKEQVGLVGMHIIMKTKEFDKWIWSTFEHIDNAPDNPQAAQNSQKNDWSFYNPQCLNCPVNEPPTTTDMVDNKPAYLWNTEKPYAKKYLINAPNQTITDSPKFGTQVTRTYPIYYCTEGINDLWQNELSASTNNSVFANYRLIGSQWEINGSDVEGDVAPFKLANLTAETYVQDKSSCLSCHRHHAQIIDGQDTIKTDFSFVLGGAN